MKQCSIETHPSLEAFFQELLAAALADAQLTLTDDTLSYVLQLLSGFGRADTLHSHAEDERGPPALVWLYARAQSGDRGQRFEAYRALGDVALFVSGIFADHVARPRALVGSDYYVAMGRQAYRSASSLAMPSAFGGLLDELSGKFEPLVEVLGQVATQTTLPCRQSGERFVEKLLDDMGVSAGGLESLPMIFHWNKDSVLA